MGVFVTSFTVTSKLSFVAEALIVRAVPQLHLVRCNCPVFQWISGLCFLSHGIPRMMSSFPSFVISKLIVSTCSLIVIGSHPVSSVIPFSASVSPFNPLSGIGIGFFRPRICNCSWVLGSMKFPVAPESISTCIFVPSMSALIFRCCPLAVALSSLSTASSSSSISASIFLTFSRRIVSSSGVCHALIRSFSISPARRFRSFGILGSSSNVTFALVLRLGFSVVWVLRALPASVCCFASLGIAASATRCRFSRAFSCSCSHLQSSGFFPFLALG